VTRPASRPVRRCGLRRNLAVAVLAGIVLTLAACGTPARPSGVYGIVLLSGGPADFVTSPLPDGLGSAKGVPTPVRAVHVWTVKGNELGKVIASPRLGPHSVFRVTLKPGTYMIMAIPRPHGATPQPQFVTVEAGQYRRVVLCVQGM